MALDNLEYIISGLQAIDTEKEVVTIVENNKDRLVELQQEQLAAGVDVDGQKRVDEYRPLTKAIKKNIGVGLGAVTDRVTFFMTGKLYDSLHAKVSADLVTVESPLATFDKMTERVGNENYGLAPDQREDFAIEITLPEFGKVLEEKTTIKI